MKQAATAPSASHRRTSPPPPGSCRSRGRWRRCRRSPAAERSRRRPGSGCPWPPPSRTSRCPRRRARRTARAATRCAIFGKRPSSTRIPPPAAHTQRLRTPVMPTSPTFCENDVYGNVLKTPPISVPSPSARSPSRQVLGRDRPPGQLAERQEHAGGLDHHHDHDETHGQDRDGIEDGHAETGAGRRELDPRRRPRAGQAHLRPIAIATRKPTPMPSSTAMLATNPRPYFTTARIDTRTSSATPRWQRIAVARHRWRRRAGRPVDSHAHQRDADDGDDRPVTTGGKSPRSLPIDGAARIPNTTGARSPPRRRPGVPAPAWSRSRPSGPPTRT